MKLNLIISAFILACATHVSAAAPVTTKPKVHAATCYTGEINFDCKVTQDVVGNFIETNISFADGRDGWKVRRIFNGTDTSVQQKGSNKWYKTKTQWFYQTTGEEVSFVEHTKYEEECFSVGPTGAKKYFCWEITDYDDE